MKSTKDIRLSKREKIMCAVTIVALGFAHTKWIVGKKRTEINTVKRNIAELESSNKDLTNLLAAIASKRSPASIPATSEPDVLPQYVMNSSNLSGIIRQLTEEDPGQFYNVKSIIGKPEVNEPTVGAAKSSTDEKPYDVIRYEVRLETSFLSIGRFIEKLEKSKLLLDVTSVDISRVDSDLKRCNAVIHLNSYIPKNKDS